MSRNSIARQSSNSSVLSVEDAAVNMATADLTKKLIKEGISVDGDVRNALAAQIQVNVAKYMGSAKNLQDLDTKTIAVEALGLTNVTSLKLLARKVKLQKREQLLSSVTPAKWWIIPPNDRRKLCWDLANVLLIIYSIFEMPFSMAFGTVDDCESTWIQNLNLFIDCCFCVDSLLNFVTAYVDYETGIVVVDTARIIARSDQ
jgi:hypothetical protein